MSTDHHTAQVLGYELTAANDNAPLSELDAAITSVIGTDANNIKLQFGAQVAAVIASGAIAPTQSFITVDTESAAASDDLDNITGTSLGQFGCIFPLNGSRTIVIKHATGNIRTWDGSDVTLDELHKGVIWINRANVIYVLGYVGTSGGIGGSTGATDNVILRADGTGGSTVQSSGLTINDSNTIEMADNVIERAEFQDYSETVDTEATSGATYTIDIENGNVHDLTLTANCTLTFSNPSPTGKSCSFTLVARQDGTGSRTITYPASVQWAGGTPPTLTTTANAIDILTFFTLDAGTTWFGFVGGLDFS